MHTRYGVALPLRNQVTQTIIDALEEHIVLRFGCPKAMLSDNGSNLHNDMYIAIVKHFGIAPKYIMPYRSNANGTVERFNQTLKKLLWFFCEQSPTKWDLYVKYACSAYNNTVHSVSGYAPITLVLGVQPRSFIHDLPATDFVPLNREQQTQTRIEFIEKARKHARENLVSFTKRQAEKSNKHRVERTFSIGDEVYVLQMTRPAGLASFYWRPFDGPYVFKSIYRENIYTLKRHDWDASKTINIHVERLKPFCRLYTEPCFSTHPFPINNFSEVPKDKLTDPLLPNSLTVSPDRMRNEETEGISHKASEHRCAIITICENESIITYLKTR